MFHEDARALAAGLRRFTADLYHRLASGKGNLFFSPLSIAWALLLVHAGARGETRGEIEQALRFDLPEDRLFNAFARLSRELEERNMLYEQEPDPLQFHDHPSDRLEPGDHLLRLIHTANFWVQRSYPCEADYLRIAQEVFGADTQTVDFDENPDEAAAAINAWVKDRTEGRIEQIFSPDMIQPLTRLILASAAYFKAGWADPFKPALTETAQFHQLDGQDVDVQMMDTSGQLDYARHDEFQIVALPYVSDGVRFVIVLPDAGRFEAVERAFDGERLDATLFAQSAFDRRDVHLRLPRLRVDAEIDVAPHLRKIGIRALFRSDADLTGISAEPGIRVDQVLHKSFVSVDEEGTEAAAATVTAIRGAGIEEPQVPIEFTCDRPFLFFINDFYSQTVLFAGRLMDPTAS